MIAIAQELGPVLARTGLREEAGQLARRAWEIADPQRKYAARRRPNLIDGYTARGYTAAGLIYAALGETARATDALKNAEAAWNRVASAPFYTREHRALREHARVALAGLQGQKGK